MVIEDSGTRQVRPPENRPGYGVGLLLWVSIPMILVVNHFLQILDLMSVAGCDGDCDYDLIDAALTAYPWEVVGSIVIGIVLHIVLRRTGRPTFWAAITAVTLVVGSAVVTSNLLQAGFAEMHERNDRLERGEFAEPELTEPVGGWTGFEDDRSSLQFSSDGSLSGSDGCDELTGQWTQDSTGLITFDELTVATGACDSGYTWLSQGRSARVFEELLYINDDRRLTDQPDETQ